MKSHPPQDTSQRERFANGQTRQKKGKVTASPKVKVKVNVKARIRENSQDQAGSPNEEIGQRTLGDFGVRRQRVAFVGDFQENDDFDPEWIEQLMCFAF